MVPDPQPAQAELDGPADPGLIPLLKALRKPGDEVQLTTAIAAIAGTDRRFASRLLRAVLEKAPRRRAAERLLAKLPDELDCRAEQRLPQVIDGWRGRIDLEFTGADGFQVLVEAKIYALYEPGQLQGYLDSSSCHGLVGIVRNRMFEQVEPEDERWLGSVRWADVIESWKDLEHADPVVGQVWRQLLEVVREQGDFGLMEFNQEDVLAWSRYKRGKETLLALLNDIYLDVREMLRREWAAAYGDSLGSPASIDTVGSRRTREWVAHLFMRFDLPNAPGAGRFQVQFVGGREEPWFTAEARWGGDGQQLTEQQKTAPELVRIGEDLRARGFSAQGAYYGDYWARPHTPDEWLQGTPADTRAELVALARADFRDLLQAGLFDALPGDDVPTA